MDDAKHNIAILHRICAMGVSIAIDDFGTGFSSLSYLAKLPVHTLKIDRSFIVDMTAGVQGVALVSTIIRLAHSLNSRSWRKTSRPRSNRASCARSNAMKCRGSCSAGRCPQTF